MATAQRVNCSTSDFRWRKFTVCTFEKDLRLVMHFRPPFNMADLSSDSFPAQPLPALRFKRPNLLQLRLNIFALLNQLRTVILERLQCPGCPPPL